MRLESTLPLRSTEYFINFAPNEIVAKGVRGGTAGNKDK